MADAPQTASPAPVVVAETTSETPKVEPSNPKDASPAPIKTEAPPQEQLNAVSPKPGPNQIPEAAPPAEASITTPPTQVKMEEGQEPVKEAPKPATAAATQSQPLSISIPASTNGSVPPPSSGNAPTPPPAGTGTGTAAVASSILASIFSGSVPTPAISPLSDVPPTKRSRTPEAGEEGTAEKRQKVEHVEQEQIDETPEVNGGDTEADPASLLSWDLGAQLSSVLGSVEPDTNDANAAAEDGAMDTMPSIPLPPPRRRLEKMKFIENPTYFSRAMGLPMLGSLSVQILLALFQQPSEVTDRQIRDVRTEGGKVYSALRQTFMAVLKLFTDATAFLSADDLDIHDPGDRETIQMANLASMCASFYGPGGPTMATAHDNFLKIMIPENGMITEDISALYLDQKTQSFLAYANVMEDKESTRNSLMDKFFPLDLEEKLKGYWRESNLTMSGDEFVKPYTDRRNLLKAIGHDKEKRKALEAKYQFASFLDNLSAFIRSNFDSILDYAESHGFEVPNEAGEEDLMLMDAVQSQYSGAFPGQVRRTGPDAGYDSAGLASLITEKLTGYDGYSYGSTIPESATLPPSQSLPTSVLYERARQAAVAKSSAHARREGLHSTRRPWTPEEEKALMAGLDMVKGPHWSQILQLFGQNGTISDILKDRTQVQLKDKARNLKLFFLKTNSEMPYYLQCVTGELKTRAPSQAARKEAEEQARVQTGGTSTAYASSYMNGATSSTGSLAHGMAMNGASRPGSATPGPSPSTPVGTSNAPHHPQQQQQPQQTYQTHQAYQQQRPQQPQQAAGGVSHTAATIPQSAAARPLAPQQSQHQPIAPAPSYQRPLQQAGAPKPTTQYQQRPVQQPAQQTPTSYQQTQRPMAAAPASSIPPRSNMPSSAAPPTAQSRPPAPVSQAPATAGVRPPSATHALPPRPASIPPASSAPSPGSNPAAAKGVPTIMPAPHWSPSTAASSASPKPIQQQQQQQHQPQHQPPPPHQSRPASQSGMQPVANKPVQTAPPPSAGHPAPAPTPHAHAQGHTQAHQHPQPQHQHQHQQPAAVPPTAAAAKPATIPASAPAPANTSSTPAAATIPTSAPAPPPEEQAKPVEIKESNEDELLANALRAAIDSA